MPFLSVFGEDVTFAGYSLPHPPTLYIGAWGYIFSVYAEYTINGYAFKNYLYRQAIQLAIQSTIDEQVDYK